jgi:hypothetical protein
MMQLTGRVAMAQGSKMVAKHSKTRPNDKEPISSSFGATEGQLQVLCAEINDLVAGGLVPKNATFEDNFENDATLADSKQ